jgi:hypothetical protein
MPGLANYDCEGVLTLGGVSMNRPAWMISADQNGNGGLFQILTNVDVRGQDRLLPGAAGVIPYRRRVTASSLTFRLVVTGDVDETGAENADATAGLVDNLEYLWDNVVVPVASSTGTRAAVWTPPNSSARTANVHVVRMNPVQYAFQQNASNSIWVGTLEISVPTGRFA